MDGSSIKCPQTVRGMVRARPKSRQPIDIEHLLIWVYQDQKADLIVDRGTGMHELERRASGIEVIKHSGDGVALIGIRGATGMVDASFVGSSDLHVDAELVHEAVRDLDRLKAGVVIDMAKSGMRPDWMPGAVARLEPMRRENGKLVHFYDPARKQPIGCRLQLVLAQDSIDFARRFYVLWWDTLAALAVKLAKQDNLTAYVPTAPGAPREPWTP